MWFGVSGKSSLVFDDWHVRGLEFNKAFVPVNAVVNSSSATSALPSTAFTARFATLIIVSCTPPKCGASGGLKCHMTPLFAVD